MEKAGSCRVGLFNALEDLFENKSLSADLNEGPSLQKKKPHSQEGTVGHGFGKEVKCEEVLLCCVNLTFLVGYVKKNVT